MFQIVVVIGCLSGGTTAVAGHLTHNGFWNNGHTNTCFEYRLPIQNRHPYHAKPKPLTDEDHKAFSKWFSAYQKEAKRHGRNRAVHKFPYTSIWIPDAWERDFVLPLLVHRNVDDCAASLAKRHPSIKDPYGFALEAQEEILALHKERDWPMWEFGPNARIEDLEEIVGVSLDKQYFDRERIENGNA